MDKNFDYKSNDDDFYRDLMEIENRKFLQRKHSFSDDLFDYSIDRDNNYQSEPNIIFPINNFKQPYMDENSENPFIQPVKLNSNNILELSSILNISHFEEIKTKEASNNKTVENITINNIINNELEIHEIKRNIRDDNAKIKIKLAVSKLYVEEYNENVKDENLKIKNFDFNGFKNISISNNLLLGETKWKDIILNNYNGNKDIIKNIIKNIYDNKEKEAIKLLEMTFQEYLEIFKKNSLEQFLENERESQTKKYKQKKYKEAIDKVISKNESGNLNLLKKYVTFGVKNKNTKKKIDLDNIEENIIKDFRERNYKIRKEKGFVSFIEQKYKEINLVLTSEEEKDIDKYIKNLRDLVENFDTWFEDKKSRKSRKKMFRTICDS